MHLWNYFGGSGPLKPLPPEERRRIRRLVRLGARPESPRDEAVTDSYARWLARSARFNGVLCLLCAVICLILAGEVNRGFWGFVGGFIGAGVGALHRARAAGRFLGNSVAI
jgi:hypothetical protein